MAAQPEPDVNREVPVLCAACGEVFSAAAAQVGAESGPAPTCPHCGHCGDPAGVMRGLTFPSVDTFVRSVARSFEAEEE